MAHSIPSPPTEDPGYKPPRKTSSSSKAAKSSHRTSKRIGTTGIISAATSLSEPHSPTSDSRHKRVWKACERCRMKKTKCDGEFPCKRCKDDGLICAAGVRKKVEFKQLPRGYAEVLESTQFSLIATIHKLYSMVQNGETWDLGDPELNDRGQPIVHNIATKLGCIRPNSDIDLPVHSVFPENEDDLRSLARQLEAQQKQGTPQQQQQQKQQQPQQDTQMQQSPSAPASTGNITPSATTDASSTSSDHDHSDLDDDLNPTPATTSSHAFLSPQSLPPYNDFDNHEPNLDDCSTGVMFHDQPTLASFWGGAPAMAPPHHQQHHHAPLGPVTRTDFLSQPPTMTNDMLTQGLLESDFGGLRPHMVSCPNPEVMMGMGDPMIYSGFGDDDGQLRL